LLRYAEHQFLAILPETDRKEAQIALDRLQGPVGVGQWNRRNQEFGYQLRLCAGIAQFVPDASTLDSMIEAAEEEIYNSRQERSRQPRPVSQ
jgi:PleD family two-component response regulator